MPKSYGKVKPSNNDHDLVKSGAMKKIPVGSKWQTKGSLIWRQNRMSIQLSVHKFWQTILGQIVHRFALFTKVTNEYVCVICVVKGKCKVETMQLG